MVMFSKHLSKDLIIWWKSPCAPWILDNKYLKKIFEEKGRKWLRYKEDYEQDNIMDILEIHCIEFGRKYTQAS